MNVKKVLRKVWGNYDGHRYIPLATEPGISFAWRVWDRKEDRFLEDKELRSIDPSEHFGSVH